MVRVSPLTAVTLPLAMLMSPKPVGAEPLGAEAPGAGPFGVLPVEPLLLDGGRWPPNPPGPPMPNPPTVQVPLEEGPVIAIVLALITPFEVVPLTVAQSPAVRAEAVTSLVASKVVDEVQITVSCPSVSLWTSMEEPLTEATCPAAAGPCPAVGGAVEPEPLADMPVVELEVAAFVLPPQAVKTIDKPTAVGKATYLALEMRNIFFEFSP